MDWTVYWFMLPVCVAVASTAMFSGISGAALLTPLFILGFPLLGVPTLTFVEAIGTSLALETSGFGSGVAFYTRRGLPDYGFAWRLLLVALPAGAVGAILVRQAPTDYLRGVYGLLMFVVAYLLWSFHGRRPETGGGDGTEHAYRYRTGGLALTLGLTGVGGTLAGLISTGIGEVTLPNLQRRIGMPVPVAAATSVIVVAATVAGAAVVHLVLLVREGGFDAVPWNLIVWAVPGAIAGAFLGTRLQGKVPERTANRFFGLLFTGIGAAFLATAVQRLGLL